MCGIVGIWSFNQPDISDKEMEIFTDTLAHRGPDGRGFYHDSSCSLRLGHRRLAILDLSKAGHQPMSYDNGRYWIVFNGEIYNYLELRRELEEKGYLFNSNSDTEVLLASYVEWGKDCQFRFNGMWAFAIWDSIEKKLFLSRDRFGIKPLHYIITDKYFAFASEMKAFLALKCYDFSFDKEVIEYAKKNIHQLETTEFCLLSDVKRLLGGHNLFFNPVEGLYIHQWWITSEHLVTVPDNQEEQVKKFKELFFDACRIRMRSDVPIGTSLSGGLDSSSVLATIHAIGKQEGYTDDFQKAFLADYPGTELDERKYAEIMIGETSAIPVITTIQYNDFVRDIQKIVYHLEDFYFVLGEGAWINYKKMKEEGVSVSMDGHGADELLAGYSSVLDDYIIYILMHPFNFNPFQYFSLKRTLYFFQGGSAKIDLSYKRDLLIFLKKIIRALKNNRQIFHITNKHENSMKKIQPIDVQKHPEKSILWNILYQYFHQNTLPTILRNFDRMSMSHGIEVRMPFMDYRLVTYVFSLPDSVLVSNNYSKWILRKSMEGLLPDQIRLRRNKIGFTSPMVKWIQDGMVGEIIKKCQYYYQSHPEVLQYLDSSVINYLGPKNNTPNNFEIPWSELHELLIITAFHEKRNLYMKEIGN